MPLVISDEVLDAAGLTEQQARVEIACRLYDAGKLSLWPAAQWAGLSRGELEAELRARQIAVYRPTEADFQVDLASIKRLEGRS